jgi:predicted nucleic acid-binding protein
MTLILDSGGVSALAGHRARLTELRNRGLWPPQVPAVVLAEALTGDARRDFRANHLLRTCQVRDIDEPMAREAARLRTATGKASKISAVDAVVAAFATLHPDPIILTSDPRDLGALAAQTVRPVTVAAT